MPIDFNLRSRDYWKQLGWGLILALISAVSALIFIFLMNTVQGIFIPHLKVNWIPFSGQWWIVVVMTIAGVIVGLIHRYTDAKEMNAFDALDKGYLDPKPVPASLLASFISLISGFSLGPEVPTGFLSAGLGTWISERLKMNSDMIESNVISSISGAYAGLFSSPFVMLIMMLESKHKQDVFYYGILLVGLLAAVIGFSVFYAFNDFNTSSLLGLLSPPAYHLELWHLLVSVVLGILAVPIALVFVILSRVFNRAVKPLNSKPVLRSTVGGLLLGLLAFVLPTTLGLGTTEMSVVTQQAAEIGVLLLIVFAFAKLVALSGALSTGFIGGPIFPLLFVGSSIGAAVNLIFPQIPIGLALGCMIVAVPAAVAPIPIALGLIGIIIIGLSPTDSLPVFISALVAYAIVHGLVISSDKKDVDEN